MHFACRSVQHAPFEQYTRNCGEGSVYKVLPNLVYQKSMGNACCFMNLGDIFSTSLSYTALGVDKDENGLSNFLGGAAPGCHSSSRFGPL